MKQDICSFPHSGASAEALNNMVEESGLNRSEVIRIAIYQLYCDLLNDNIVIEDILMSEKPSKAKKFKIS